MRKVLLTALATATIVASVASVASAGERHSARSAQRAADHADRVQQLRDSNAYFGSSYDRSDWDRLRNGGLSAPAGR